MATYSRSQTVSQQATQTAQTSTLPSMDVSSLLVKTMENVLNNSEDENDYDTDNSLEDTITKAINNSDLIKDKEKDDKKNNNEELVNLLKNDKKSEKKEPEKSEQNKDSDFGKIVSGGIIDSNKIAGTSDLLKDKTNYKNDTNNLLKDKTAKPETYSDLLKDKTDNTKELLDLLKSKKDENSKDSKKEKKTTVKSNSDKASGTLGKIISGGIIASTIKGVMGSSKGLLGGAKGAVSGALAGTGKVAGGLVSGVGNIGGSAIAGIGKLFGPVGAIVGKAVGTAVATPFKVVGGTITAAIGGLGKLMSMPLKELVTKGTLIVGVLSQLFVFLEGLMAKFIAEKDIKWIDFMSKLKSNIATIPDKLMVSLEQILSKVRILGKPIYGSLSKDEKKELKSLEKDKDIKAYNKAMKGVDEVDRTLNTMSSQMGASGINATDYDLDTEEGRNAYKAAVITSAKQSHIENGMPELNEDYANAELDKWLANRDKERAAAEEKVKGLKIDEEKLNTYLDLKDRSKQALTADYFDKKRQDIETKQEGLQEQYFTQGLYDLSNKQVKDKNGNIVTRGLTEYEQNYADTLHAGSVATVKDMHSEAGTQLTTKDATGAERFLQNQYKQWTDSWSKMFKDLKQDIGINITQKQDIPNPSYYNR